MLWLLILLIFQRLILLLISPGGPAHLSGLHTEVVRLLTERLG